MKPVIGQWYITQQGTVLEVVAIDSQDGSIEVQYFDGTVDEFDPKIWDSIKIEESAPPEDYSGSLDITADDYVMASQFVPKKDWVDPRDFIDTEYLEPETRELRMVTSEEPK